MTAFRARALLGGFLLIFAGVACNAMLLQDGGMSWRDRTLLGNGQTADASKPVKPQERRVETRRVLPRWNPDVTASIGVEETAETVEDATDENVRRPARGGAISQAGQLTAGPEGVTAPAQPSLAFSVTPTRQANRETVRAIQRELVSRGYEPGPVDGILGIMTRAAVMAYEHDERLTLTADPSDGLLERIILGGVGQSPAARPGAPGQNARLLARSVQESLARLGYVPGAADGIVSSNTERAIRAFERDHNLASTGRISGRLVAEIGRVNGARFSIAAGW